MNIYDEHGKEGSPSPSTSDFSPLNDRDNSIRTNKFDPTSGAGYCVTLTPAQPPQPTPIGTVGGAGLALIVGGMGGFMLWRQRHNTVADRT